MKKTIFASLAFIAFAQFVSAQLLFPKCTELYFTEYIEGTGKNRAVEIYNPSENVADLSQYSIKCFASGPNNPNVLQLSGTLPAKGRTSCGNSQADPNILVLCDFISSELKFDGDDAVGLYKNDTLIDMIGEIGVNPGNTGWQVGTGFTKNNTLRRKYDVWGPTVYWTQSVFEWDVFPIDDISDLGDYTGMCPIPTVSFVTTASTVNESTPTIGLSVTLTGTSNDFVNVWIEHNPFTPVCEDPALMATWTVDYSTLSDMVTYFPLETGTKTFTINIVDDAISEPFDEFICFEIDEFFTDATVVSPKKHKMKIKDNDPVAIKENKYSNGIKISPNPASDYLTIGNYNPATIKRINITNVLGQEVINLPMPATGKINIKALDKGIYFINLYGDTAVITTKFIKE